MSCGVARRHSSDLALLWLRCRPAAIALIGLLAWEPPHAVDVALESQKKKSILSIQTTQPFGNFKTFKWSSPCGSAVTNPTSVCEGLGLIPGLVQWVKALALL